MALATVGAILGFLACGAHAQALSAIVTNANTIQSHTSAVTQVLGAGESRSAAHSTQALSAVGVAHASWLDSSRTTGHADADSVSSSMSSAFATNIATGGGSGSASADGTTLTNTSASSLFGNAAFDVAGGSVDSNAQATSPFSVASATNGQVKAGAGYAAAAPGTSDATSTYECPGTRSTATSSLPAGAGASAPPELSGSGAVLVSNAAGNAQVLPTAWTRDANGCDGGGGSGGNN